MTPERLRLLLAEDDEVDVTSIQRALHKRGLNYPLHVFSNGEEALAALRSGQVPLQRLLVLLDLYMPKLDGLETLRALRQDPQLSLLPVVLLTTSSDEQAKLKAYQLNVSGYLRKPVDPEELEEQLEALCNYWAANEMP
jgi:CheY-like chemotaxis protein